MRAPLPGCNQYNEVKLFAKGHLQAVLEEAITVGLSIFLVKH